MVACFNRNGTSIRRLDDYLLVINCRIWSKHLEYYPIKHNFRIPDYIAVSAVISSAQRRNGLYLSVHLCLVIEFCHQEGNFKWMSKDFVYCYRKWHLCWRHTIKLFDNITFFFQTLNINIFYVIQYWCLVYINRQLISITINSTVI